MRLMITFTRWLVKFVRILITLKVQVVIVSLLCHVMKLSIPLKNENLLLTSGIRSVQLREGLHLGVIVEESVDLETIGRLEVQTEGDTAAKGPFESAETTGVFTAGC